MKRSQRLKKISKRNIPDEKLIFWREGFLFAMRFLSPNAPDNSDIFLENGNSKIGKGNAFYNKVFVWNLPPVISCPSASTWCTKHCYNADSRNDVFPIDKWNGNFYLVKNDINFVKKRIIEATEQACEPTAFRIHSSGDFFSIEYIRMWKDIIEACPKVSFWAYTRSWKEKDLLEELENLNKLKNIQLFASWDHTMPEPPSTWRKSIVYKLDDTKKYDGLVCPEQSGKSPDCISCKFCIKKGKENVLFILH